MTTLLTYALLGLAGGSVVALLTVGVVCQYKASGVVNFAHAAMAMYFAYCFSELCSTGNLVLPVVGISDAIPLAAGGMASGPAAAVTALYAAVFGLVVYLLVFRPMRQASQLAKLVASVGLMLTLQTLAILQFGSQARFADRPLPSGTVSVLGAVVATDRLIMAGIALAVGLLLALVYARTGFGIATRAIGENERSAMLLGHRPSRIEAANWVLSGVLAAVAGILAAPILSLSPGAFSLVIVATLAAALVGGFTSFPIAVLGGLGIGMAQSLSIYAASELSWLPQQGLPDVVPFVIITIVLLVRARGVSGREAVAARLPAAPRLPYGGWIGLFAVAVAVFSLLVLSGGWRAALIQSLITACVCLSFVLVTGFVGQASLAQLAFAGVGGFVLAKVLAHADLPFVLGLLVAGLVAVPAGLLVGVPALRIRGVNLAIITLSAGIAVSAVVFNNEQVSGTSGVVVPPPTLFGADLGIYGDTPADYPRLAFGLVALGTLTVLALLVANVRRSPSGYHFLAVRSNEQAAGAIGIGVASTKLTAFAMSAFVAGAAGGLIGYQQGQLSPDSFTVYACLSLFAISFLGGIGTVPGAILAGLALAPGGLMFTALDRWLDLGGYQPLIAGVGVILAAVTQPDGAAALSKRFVRKGRRSEVVDIAPDRAADEVAAAPVAAAPVAAAPVAAELVDDGRPLLEVSGLTVRFGGVVALDGADVAVRRGTIHGLIGPNGAGKSTFIETITGFHRQAEGYITFEGQSLDRVAPHDRARQGLVRTFQGIQLFGDLTVRENLLAAAHRRTWKSSVVDLVWPMRNGTPASVDAALEVLGLADLADRLPDELSQGQRKLVGVARALACRPRLVLLDEPAAGLDEEESALLGERLRTLVAHGVTILLVEHDMKLVLDVCDQVTVLDFGKVITTGRPDEILRDERVIRAYLGPGAMVEATS